ncbi:NADPH-dependent F420 reductase [Gordonia soli]|uniref:Putative oxidoreductase n=1 Tax=Gordonia soli NBRC 108243 TaxID=1223545 RepID=M0QNV3_9ACTN|nr:NAD(P)-binding domain-containing protein [Gordonia soli]GAC69117.1 putative oxidoreductase [Gordonia soli NBRC 108243]
MNSPTSHHRPLRIGVWGAGNVARALAGAWTRAGHSVAVSSRSRTPAVDLAQSLGPGVSVGSFAEVTRGVDAVVVALPWAAVDSVLDEVVSRDPESPDAESSSDDLAGVTIIDPTNPVVHAVGSHLLPTGSAADHIASRIPAAHVVKAFNVYPAPTWADVPDGVVVPIAGDDARALALTSRLVGDVGATAHVLGPLDRARQIEELAGAVIGLAFAGTDPRSAVPGLG